MSMRLELEEALIQSEKVAAIGRLASSIAHEINNPLTAATNYLYLARSSEDITQVHEYLAIIEREIERAATISRQTLLSQKRSAVPSTISVESLVVSVLSLYQLRIRDLSIRVETRHRARHPLVCLEGDIRQVLGNLIANGIDSMQSGGGRLLIRSRDSTGWKTGQPTHTITVADTGCGIAPGAMKKLFQPFFTTRGFDGNGLGLWISHEIVTRLNGSLRVRSSTREGKHGSVFVLTLSRLTTHCPTTNQPKKPET